MHDGPAVVSQLLGVLSTLAAVPVWIFNQIIRPEPLAVLDQAFKATAGFALICAVLVLLRIVVLAKRFSRAVIVRAEAVAVDPAVRWLPMAYRTDYPLRVSFELAGTRHSSQVFVRDPSVYRRIQQDGFTDVVVDPQERWNIYAAELYLKPSAT